MTFPKFNPLIRNKKYLTQFGQLKTVTRNKYGDVDPALTTITTIRCMVYLEDIKQLQTNPAISLIELHRACIPSSLRNSVDVHDHLAEVTDRHGNVVLADSRVTKIVDYNHWKHAPRFFVVHLDVDLD